MRLPLPGSKKKPVWFSELGFPSVDGCSNQPAAFADPDSSENSYPIGSRGRVDFLAQHCP
ncbi:MAG: glycoside hydrolase TIM-barrel-like domain-containing protein [Alphaproteobacteria bacterium]|nr:glycoside hydrolase TIM-barrel-like domain-containing protein [Alphaproteobacteria bacterium]